MRFRGPVFALAVVVLLLATAAGLFVGLRGGHPEAAPARHAARALEPSPAKALTPIVTHRVTTQQLVAPTPLPTTPAAPAAKPKPKPTPDSNPLVPTSTTVAVLKGDAPGSATPGGPVTQTVPGNWYGWVSKLPVIKEVSGWLEVRMAQRPNESTAWIPAADATLTTTPDTIVVNLSTRHLQLYVDGVLKDDFPAGIGLPSTPTTPGNFFVAFTEPPPDSGYGPFIMVTSAHSDAIQDWDGSGDAIIGIHGPITAEADAQIGTTGASLSNGCIRLHVVDQQLLSSVPAGTPINIVS